MSVIKQFFAHEREVELRKAEWKKQKLEKLKQQKPVPQVYNCDKEFSEFDFLLRRNWFYESQDIIDLVWDASEEAFQKIMENVYTYPDRVTHVLVNEFQPIRYKLSAHSRVKLTSMTDKDIQTLEQAKTTALKEKFESEWQLYKKEHGLSRPEGDVDDRYTELYEKLQRTKKDLETEIKSPKSKRYVPPSRRDTIPVSPEVERLQMAVARLENEIVDAKKDIVREEYIWEYGRKTEFSHQIMYKVFGL